MRRTLACLLLGVAFLCLQTALLARLLPLQMRPDLLLLLGIYLGLTQGYLRGGVLAYALGCLQDAFTAAYLGLYGLTLLVIFLVVRGLAPRLNTESSFPLLFLVGAGTLLQAGVLLFALGFFAEAADLWRIVLSRLLLQLLLNLGAAWLLLRIALRLQRRFAPRLSIPGLERLEGGDGT
jgi:rod shape-determining protein MreD